MEIAKIGIVGAGQMGNGIAHVCALAGYEILMTDMSQEALDNARALIDRNLERQVAREKITADDKAAALKLMATPRSCNCISSSRMNFSTTLATTSGGK